MDLLDPKNDLVFKMVLTRRKELLLDMLTGVLARPIRDLTVTNPTIPGDLSADKQIILDIHAELADESHVDLEMQIRAPPELASRLLFYATRDYSRQLRRGDEYHLLNPTATIVWLVEPLFTSIPHLHSIFELRDRVTGTRFTDQLAIHVLQLSNLTPSRTSSRPTSYTASVHRWARFLTARTRADYEQLAAEHPIMNLAKQTLEQLSMDPEAHRLAQEREDSLKLYKMSLHASKLEGKAEGKIEGKIEGKAEGKTEGKAELLLKQLDLRFGPLPADTRARVESATPEQFDAWAERVITAATLDEVLSP